MGWKIYSLQPNVTKLFTSFAKELQASGNINKMTTKFN